MSWPIGRPAHNRVPAAVENEVLRLYRGGASYSEIRRSLGLGGGTLDRIRRRRGLISRSRKEAQRRQ